MYICVCVCVQNQSYEGMQTDRWLANVSAWTHTHVWHLHISCSVSGRMCAETQEFLHCLRAEKKSYHRGGWERKVTYPVSCRWKCLVSARARAARWARHAAPFLLTLEGIGPGWGWHMDQLAVKGLIPYNRLTQILLWRGCNLSPENGSVFKKPCSTSNTA